MIQIFNVWIVSSKRVGAHIQPKGEIVSLEFVKTFNMIPEGMLIQDIITCAVLSLCTI